MSTCKRKPSKCAGTLTKNLRIRRWRKMAPVVQSIQQHAAEHANTTIGRVLKRRKVSMREPIILNLCYMASKTEVRILPTARGRSLLINKCFLAVVFKCLLWPANDRASQSASHLEFLPSKFRVCEKPLSWVYSRKHGTKRTTNGRYMHNFSIKSTWATLVRPPPYGCGLDKFIYYKTRCTTLALLEAVLTTRIHRTT